ncbi:MAG: DUF2905 domain-containing protein [Fimbriimonadaceae bacterium]|nr:DUF2905 domain-containing protein [Fimbriimonadaceae bacterium]QYK56212.1 MAG: DUF2905 domain-containing protein [Fimbriimonadaceae bacterium]
MQEIGKWAVAAGLTIAAIGAAIWLLGAFLPGLRIGRLPGDIVVERPNFSFYFPIATMILVSAVLTLVMWIVGMVRR